MLLRSFPEKPEALLFTKSPDIVIVMPGREGTEAYRDQKCYREDSFTHAYLDFF